MRAAEKFLNFLLGASASYCDKDCCNMLLHIGCEVDIEKHRRMLSKDANSSKARFLGS